jgi:two-component system chemotaxis response regulator CheB
MLPPSVVLIGASTGGPQALITLIGALAPVLPLLPVCVTLHMPHELMPVIAAHVAKVCRVPTLVVTQRMPLKSGIVHFASGDHHCSFERSPAGVDVVPKSGSSSDYCKPAVDVMFTSAAVSHGSRALGIVLSGMGRDGLVGARAIVAAGGSVIVQDKETSAVWGMPGVIAKADLASAVRNPLGLADYVVGALTSSAEMA